MGDLLFSGILISSPGCPMIWSGLGEDLLWGAGRLFAFMVGYSMIWSGLRDLLRGAGSLLAFMVGYSMVWSGLGDDLLQDAGSLLAFIIVLLFSSNLDVPPPNCSIF